MPKLADKCRADDEPEKGLNLSHRLNRKALRQMDWAAIRESKKREPSLSVESLFLAAICNPASCPIGWDECQREDWQMCHYYALFKTVAAIEHNKPQRVEEVMRG